MNEPSRRRGRPRAFDTDKALKTIIDVFRKQGFDAASLDDISAATGLSRPSLYAAFGNKSALYLAAIEAFSANVTKQAATRLHQAESVETVLKNFFDALVDIYAPEEGSGLGCLIWGTAPAAVHAKEVQERLAAALSELDALFAGAITSDGADEKPRAAAELLANTVIGVSTRARAGTEPAVIRAHTDRVAKFIAAALDA